MGGSTRIPYIKKSLEQKFGCSVLYVDDPELAIANGAAIYGNTPISEQNQSNQQTKVNRDIFEQDIPNTVETEEDIRRNVNNKDLEQILASGQSKIVLKSETYFISNTITIDRSLELMGRGYQNTKIISTARNCALNFIGQGKLILKSLSLEHQGENPANLVTIRGGEIEIKSCHFSGALKHDISKNIFGAGIYCQGCKGIVAGNIFYKNMTGIYAGGATQIRIEGNDFTKNQIKGITYGDNAKSTAFNNSFYANPFQQA